MWQSLSEYLRGLFHLGWLMLIGLLAAPVGFDLDVGQTTGWTPIELPHSVWRALWVIGLVVVLLIAPFLAYHKLRLERDALRAFNKSMPGSPSTPILAESQLFISNPSCEFGRGGEANLGGLDPSKLYAMVDAVCNAQSDMTIERVALQIEGQESVAIH